MIQSAVAIVRPASAYEVTVTLKVASTDLEDVVARTMADPHCVDIRVHNAAHVPCWATQVDRTFERQDSQWRKP
jgi:hypothetical protein